ncbi:hemagglutinin repeat-containing protein [Xanthomonas sacchari]
MGGNANLSTTQGDITLTASNIAAQGDVTMHAAGDLTIQSGQDTAGNANVSDNKAIGTVVISDTERFSGYHTEKHRDDNATVTRVASSVGSLGGNVNLSAGGTYTQSASNVVAAKDVDVTASPPTTAMRPPRRTTRSRSARSRGEIATDRPDRQRRCGTQLRWQMELGMSMFIRQRIFLRITYLRR